MSNLRIPVRPNMFPTYDVKVRNNRHLEPRVPEQPEPGQPMRLWSRTVEDGSIVWRMGHSDLDGFVHTMFFSMKLSHAMLVGESQARWQIARELRIQRNMLRTVLRERNELISATKDRSKWH